MFLHDAAGDGQAQAGTVILGGEERFKHLRQILRGDARAGIGHGDAGGRGGPDAVDRDAELVELKAQGLGRVTAA